MNVDELVAKITKKLVRRNGAGFMSICWPGMGFWSFRQVLDEHVTDDVFKLVIDATSAAIREAILETRKQTLLEAEKVVAEYCSDADVCWGSPCIYGLKHGDPWEELRRLTEATE